MSYQRVSCFDYGESKRRWCVFATAMCAWALMWCPVAAGEADTYTLGPNDEIKILSTTVEEVADKIIRVDSDGSVHIPMIGRMQATGVTAKQLGLQIEEKLKLYFREPDVGVIVTDFRSQPVSIIGAVNNAGIYQVQGKKTLIEVLSLAGGLRADAGHSVKITRKRQWGEIPLPSAAPDSTGEFSVAEENLRDIMAARNPAANILVCPQDVISVPSADAIYIVGEVGRPGGHMLKDRRTMSALQAVSLAEGLRSVAAPQNARVLRVDRANGQRTEVAVDLRKIMNGKAADIPLEADDILFVPSNTTKKVSLRAVEALVQAATGFVIWRGSSR